MISVVSCKQANTAIDGAYISSISHSEISLDNGSQIELNDDDRMYILVRHAEKDTISKSDPNLTDYGYQRSYKLADIFRKSRIDMIYSTMFMRTLMTGDSIAKSKGLSLKPYDPKELKTFAEQIKNDKENKRFLVVGHSNTTPTLANHILDEEVLSQFDESDYDNLLVIVEDNTGQLTLHNLKFKPEN